MEDTFGLDRENEYELYQPDEWEADAAMDDETDWMRRCGALKAYDVESVGALSEKGYDWRWRASGHLKDPRKNILELLTYYDEQFDGYWEVTPVPMLVFCGLLQVFVRNTGCAPLQSRIDHHA